MKFVRKLDFLMSEMNINRKELSKATGIPYTTLSSFYDETKGTDNIKLSNLKKLADFFGCSLDFIANDNIQISDLEKHKKIDEPSFVEEDPSIADLGKYFKDNKDKLSALPESDKEKLIKMIDIYLD